MRGVQVPPVELGQLSEVLYWLYERTNLKTSEDQLLTCQKDSSFRKGSFLFLNYHIMHA